MENSASAVNTHAATAMARTEIEIIGARQNNLKNISVNIPRDKLTVITGVSGSGKSSLAFDIVYGEAQRRFLESISNFAKSRINQVKKAKVDFVRGLSPVIAIEQKKGNSNPRSTVGTVTDINDYIRLLFATAGVGKCPICSHPLKPVSAAQIAEHASSSLEPGTVIELRAPIFKIYGEEWGYLLDKMRGKGYKYVKIDGESVNLSDKVELDENKDYNIEVIIDTFTISPNIYMQIAKSIEAATVSIDDDISIKVEVTKGDVPENFYKDFECCPEHHFILCELQAFYFSFNIGSNACHTCQGIGRSHVVEPRFLIVAPEKSIMKGGLKSMIFNTASKDSHRGSIMYSLAKHFGFSLDTPINELSKDALDVIFYGSKGEVIEWLQPPFAKKRSWIVGRKWAYGGIVHDIESWYRNFVRKSVAEQSFEPGFVQETMIEKTCPECNGARLKKQRLAVTVGGKNIDELARMQLPDLVEFLNGLTFDVNVADVAKSIINELNARLILLIDIGLHYLSLARRSDTISGGEMQRIKMSTQISSELMGMLYIMDEPSIGLHARDSIRVIQTMKKLRDLGNTVIVVEHDVETMKNSDYMIEIGPGPGVHGGNIIACGTYKDIMNCKESVTGQYLSGEKFIPTPSKRRPGNDKYISIYGAKENNLKNIDVEIPLGTFVCITGVSGSGKSTLINEVLFKELEIMKKGARIVAGAHDHILGVENVTNVINIDQSPIGRGSKSNPATYIGIYDKIRDIYAETEEAVKRGYRALDFSLTHSGGVRCEHCTGDGILVTNLQFMADIETVCPVCKGERFCQEGLEVKYHGKSIADVLNMTTEEALDFFEDVRYLKHKLGIMNDLGLGYITLGQSSTTLSGGEAQRVKLAYELAKIKRGVHNVYILDEPTTGLHLSDIQKLLQCLYRLVDNGHTVIVIEHNLDVIKCADYIIDMGPEGGNGGGYVVASGTPEDIVRCKQSYTGKYLREYIE
ncbi:MAG: excinuclease ABC subunit UvrA [Oscillospiraceae bacterium]|nr:excinuclease ABC subunit UvrA [Oscillospiraceae bacterium]